MKRAWILVVVAACKHGSDAPADPAAVSVQPTPMGHSERRATESEAVGYVGVLTPRETSEVTAPFTSRVQKLMVGLGETVKKGQAIAVLDDRPLRDELAIAKAELKQASMVSGAAASRYATERQALKANVSSRADVTAAGFESGKAGAVVEQARTKIAQIEQRLKETKLTATIDGKVALRYVDEGARVTEGQPVLRVISSGELFVKFAVPSDDSRKVSPGDLLEIRFEKTKTVTQGVVKTVAPELDPIAQMILAEAEIKDPPKELQSGLVCRIVPRKK